MLTPKLNPKALKGLSQEPSRAKVAGWSVAASSPPDEDLAMDASPTAVADSWDAFAARARLTILGPRVQARLDALDALHAKVAKG